MAQIKYSANLSAADFTLSFSYKGPSVVIPGPDQNYFQAFAGWSGNTPQRGTNVPQIAYCENTVPTAEGYKSVAYKYFVQPIADPVSVAGYFSLFDGEGRSAMLAVTSDRKLYLLSATTGLEWVKISGPIESAWTLAGQVTTVTINGLALVCIATVGLFEIDLLTSTLVYHPVTGIDTSQINGICSAVGYLIAWDDTTIYWSSTADPFDFTPSLITGAGSAQITGMKGSIRLLKDLAQGFVVYTDVHIISAAYSSNLAIPWIFEILAGGSGIKWAQHVSEDINNQIHFVWATGGLLAVEQHKITPQFPQVTDFLASGTTDEPSTTALPSTSFLDDIRAVKLSLIAARYLCVSFGTYDEPVENHYEVHRLKQAFLYDLQLKRWGKLNVDHAQIVETPFSTEGVTRNCHEQVVALTAQLFNLEKANAATQAQIDATNELFSTGFVFRFLPASYVNSKYAPLMGKFVSVDGTSCVLESGISCGTAGTAYDVMNAVTDVTSAAITSMIAGPTTYSVTGSVDTHGHGINLVPGKSLNQAGRAFIPYYIICADAATPTVGTTYSDGTLAIVNPSVDCASGEHTNTATTGSIYGTSTGPTGNIAGGTTYKCIVGAISVATKVHDSNTSGTGTVTGAATGSISCTIGGTNKTITFSCERS